MSTPRDRVRLVDFGEVALAPTGSSFGRGGAAGGAANRPAAAVGGGAAPPSVQIGTPVQFKSFSGCTIAAVNGDGTYDVKVPGVGIKDRIQGYVLRLSDGTSLRAAGEHPLLGTPVKFRSFSGCTIAAVKADGSFDINVPGVGIKAAAAHEVMREDGSPVVAGGAAGVAAGGAAAVGSITEGSLVVRTGSEGSACMDATSDVGRVKVDDGSSMPYHVECPTGGRFWFYKAGVALAPTGSSFGRGGAAGGGAAGGGAPSAGRPRVGQRVVITRGDGIGDEGVRS